jgi:TolA-binding protein
MKDPAGATKEFNFFMQRHPKSALVANALFQLGNIEWGGENWAAAKKYYTRILAEYPNFQMLCWAKNYLAFCYDKETSWRKAVELYNEVRGGGACDKEAKEFAKKQIQAINVKH